MYRRETPWDIVKPLLFFLGSILWLEGIYRAFYVRPFFDVGLVYILLFSLPLAGMCALLTSLWGKKGNRKAGFAVLGVLTLWYMIQSVYHTIFATVLVTKSFNMAGQALGSYWKETLLGIWEALPALLLLAVHFGVARGHITADEAAAVRADIEGAAGSDRRRDHRAGRSSAGDRPAHRRDHDDPPDLSRDLCPRPDGLPLRPGHHPAAGYRADPLWPGGTQPPRPG